MVLLLVYVLVLVELLLLPDSNLFLSLLLNPFHLSLLKVLLTELLWAKMSLLVLYLVEGLN